MLNVRCGKGTPNSPWIIIIELDKKVQVYSNIFIDIIIKYYITVKVLYISTPGSHKKDPYKAYADIYRVFC